MNRTEKLKVFFYLMYQPNLIPIIDKPTRVGKNSATAINRIITNYVLPSDLKTAILKTDLTNHFSTVIALKMMDRLSNIQKINIYINAAVKKKISNLGITDYFESIGMKLKKCDDPSKTYKLFLIYLTQFMIAIYFPNVLVRLKIKHIQSPWVTKGIAKSSKGNKSSTKNF